MSPVVGLWTSIALAGCGDGGGQAGGDAGAPETDAGTDAATGCPIDVTPRAGTVLTATGAVTGELENSRWSWKGIPYAAPPTGELRWRAPAAAACWSGERMATELGPQCPQLSDGVVVGSEDCLTLNVWAPADAAGAPVLFFIHGGGNTVGSASDPLYDGGELATRTGSVVVTVEYRLGALGFFAHGALNDENEGGVSGNYGVLDQVAALGWVQANIAGFGGDPARVMVFGESAGGQDTLVHLASPRSAGLFSSALVESGGVYKTTLDEGIAAMAAVVDTLGCGGRGEPLACLRGKPAAEIAAIPSALGPLDPGLHYTPLVDGEVLPDNAYEVIARGEHNRVPLVIGTNAHETSRMVPSVSTEAEYEAAVKASYGIANGNALLAQYPAASYPTPRAALIALTTDVTWTCPIRRLAGAAAASQDQPVFRYYFTWTAPGPAGAVVGATHGIELPFVFRSFSAFDFSPNAAALALSESIQGYWGRLAATGDPNGGGQAAWPAYQAGSDLYLELGDAIGSGDGLSTAGCDVIEGLAE